MSQSFPSFFTVSITSKPCLAQDGQEIIFTPLDRKLKTSKSLPILISLTGSSDRETLKSISNTF